MFRARALINWSDEEVDDHTMQVIKDEIIYICEVDPETNWWPKIPV